MRTSNNDSSVATEIASIGHIENFSLFGLRNERGNWIKRRALLGDLYIDMGGSRPSVINADILLRTTLPPLPPPPPCDGCREPVENCLCNKPLCNECSNFLENCVCLIILPPEEVEFTPDRSYEFYFEPNTAIFRTDPSESLQKMFNDLTARGGMDAIIFGHVANTGRGDTISARRLSLDRAFAVANRLIDDYGIDPRRLKLVGMGNLASADTLSEYDRRVDVIFVVNP
jgi:outer membrane protein OmpA-like peptidoglycan-associated protein